MALLNWVLIGGVAWLIKEGLKKSSVNEEDDDTHGNYESINCNWDGSQNGGGKKKGKSPNKLHSNSVQALSPEKSELNRIREVNSARKDVPCFFNDGLSREVFKRIAQLAGKRIPRIVSITTHNAVIWCKVVSQSGSTFWYFSVDFNDWGHITGTRWTQTDNDDSRIPMKYGKLVADEISTYYSDRGIVLEDYSDYVDENHDLGTTNGLTYTPKKKWTKRLFAQKAKWICMEDDSADLIHEHLYPIISKLKKLGFNNIKSIPIADANNINNYYVYEIAQISISGESFFTRGYYFSENAEIILYYHIKQEISMPFSEKKLKGKDYMIVGRLLSETGFTEIIFRGKNDLITGWIKKAGSVERVCLLESGFPIKKGCSYCFDTKIVITYHDFKRKQNDTL